MKSFIKKVFMLVFACTVVMLFNTSQVKAADKNVIDLQPEKVDDIENVTNPASASSTDMSTVYRFKLDQPAYVEVGLLQTFDKSVYAGRIDAIVSSDESGSSQVYNGYAVEINEPIKRRLFLEAGTYYVSFNLVNNLWVSETGTTSVSIAVQYIERTTTGNTTIMKAKEVSKDKPIVGFLSNSNHKQYYKFILDNKSKVDIGFIANVVFKDGDDLTNGRLYDKNFTEIANVDINQSGSAVMLSKTLDKGTYYVALEQNPYKNGNVDYYNYFGETYITINATKANINTPKVKTCKVGTKVVSGTAEKNSEVYVVCNGDTFFTTASSSGKYKVNTTKLDKGKKIKVYVIKNGVKSKVTEATVK